MELPGLSAKEQLILSLLLDAKGEKLYGLQMVEAAGGQLRRGTVYVTLGRMEEKGLVESEQEPPGPGVRGIPRRLYSPTGLGVRALRTSSDGPLPSKTGRASGLAPGWGV